MAKAPEKLEAELTFGEKLNDFMQKYRKIFVIGFCAIVIILTAFIIGSYVRDKMRENALTRLDELMQHHEELKGFIGSDMPDALGRQIELVVLLEELADFAGRNSGFAAARAHTIRADIFWDQENWREAEQAWLEAARSSPQSYLAPISFYNAAVAAEEHGNTEAAISHYRSALTFGDVFPVAARAQFSIGRLEETRNNRDAAIAAYRNLLNTWPDDPVWPALAQSRILMLTE